MWLKLITWLTLLQLLAGALSQELKIFGGITEPVRNYPFLVNLRRGPTFKCGGALIAPSCVVTAAHCLENDVQNVDNLYVNAQQDCLNDSIPDSNVRQAWYACISPQYKPINLDADLAVIKLRQPFYTSDIINTVAVDFNDPPEDARMRIVGWGMTNEEGLDWGQCLQSADVSLVRRDQCNRQMSLITPITKNMFCALGENKIDACQGDSGSPILYGGRVVGVVSWGKDCGSGLPGVYTRFSSSSMMWFLQSFIETNCLD
ncbi:chymotrypsin-1 [Drosophila mojavensis]|uniref:chymotrypsin-1 n=1 Tax=Drosophila mojavensis TaxID=7230 RepID=UPI001CD05F88|nr:chymotrypsin-1 [Drosophila mojavensis]